ncbi:MAG: hypothetical protein ACPMAQ_05140 [Phycisphaerae bacterium]
MFTSSRATCERLDMLQMNLDRLKRELAEAWASPDRSDQIPVIEQRIREVWDQMDGLAVALSEPMTARN